MIRGVDGTQSAWIMLERLPHDEVCRNACARFVPSSDSYALTCFGWEILVCPTRREISSTSPASDTLLHKSRYFSELSILRYLAGARDVSLSAKLIRPTDLRAGRIFAEGSHVLPLDKLAQKYGGNIQGFLARGQELHAENAGLGDASLRLWPFPRIPVVIVLWKECEEFQARADLLLDSTCEVHLPQDIVWATAMVSILMLM